MELYGPKASTAQSGRRDESVLHAVTPFSSGSPRNWATPPRLPNAGRKTPRLGGRQRAPLAGRPACQKSIPAVAYHKKHAAGPPVSPFGPMRPKPHCILTIRYSNASQAFRSSGLRASATILGYNNLPADPFISRVRLPRCRNKPSRPIRPGVGIGAHGT